MEKETFDFNVHQKVGIRLVSPTDKDIKMVERQLGPLHEVKSASPDIVIRFVDKIPTRGSVRYLGDEEAAFSKEGFMVLRGKHKARTKVLIPFDRIGQQCEIVCERGGPEVPLLVSILNATMLVKGWLPLHASAFEFQGAGILVTGWTKGGKTEALLAFAAHEARYIGDEWVYLSEGGEAMHGLPEPMHVWDWHLAELPDFWKALTPEHRIKLRLLQVVYKTLERFGRGSKVLPAQLNGVFRRLTKLIERQLFVHLPPETLFGPIRPETMHGKVDKVFFAVTHASPEVVVRRMDSQAVAQRMVHSLQQEQTKLIYYYNMFRFAFPDRVNPLIPRLEEIQGRLLSEVLENKEAYAVYHPYPVSLPALYRAMRPYCKLSEEKVPEK